MADPKEAKAAAPPAGAAAKKPGGSKLVVILLAVNTLLTAGVLAYQFLRPAGGGKGASEKAEKADKAAAHAAEAKANAVGPTVRLADFTVHLRDTDADHYARVTFDLEVATDEDKNRVSLAIPRIRDVVIAYLADRSFDELRGSDALVRTKEHLLDKIKQTLPGTVVKSLYISDIVVQ
jgi:flagellar FliL protein